MAGSLPKARATLMKTARGHMALPNTMPCPPLLFLPLLSPPLLSLPFDVPSPLMSTQLPSSPLQASPHCPVYSSPHPAPTSARPQPFSACPCFSSTFPSSLNGLFLAGLSIPASTPRHQGLRVLLTVFRHLAQSRPSGTVSWVNE